MNKRFQIIIILFLGVSFVSLAQTNSTDCYDLLEKAERFFKIGKIDRVEAEVLPCLRKQLPSGLRKEILKLLIETNLFLDEDEKAEKYFQDLKFLDPFAKSNYLVPETIYLTDKFETYPSTTYSFHTGGTPKLTPVNLDGSPEGVEVFDQSFKRERGDLFGWFIGADAAFNLNNSKWDASIGYTFYKNYYRYSANLKDALYDLNTGERTEAALSFYEQSNWSQLTLGLVYQFKKRDRFQKVVSPYLFVRLGGNYLHPNSSKLNELIIDFPSKNELRTDPPLDISQMRSRLILSVKAGAAVRVRIYRQFFAQGGIVYHRTLTNIAKANPGDQNYQRLVNRFNFKDDNFTGYQIGFFGGFGYYLFKTKRK